MIDLLNNKYVLIIITPLMIVISILLIWVYFISPTSVLFFGKEFGKINKIDFYSKESHKLNLAYALTNQMNIKKCVDISKKTLTKLEYENIVIDNDIIRGIQKDNIALIKCADYSIVPIALYARYKDTSKKLVDKILYTFQEEEQKKSNITGYDLTELY